jgi:alpha-1,2-mannosyltransferase
VPWNIVAYNVFSDSSKGPNIYGTEPWHYYLRNLILNFTVWLPLALLAAPLILIQYFLRHQTVSKQSYFRNLTIVAPFYLWLGVFTLQPHKEERFMYPAYPFLAVNAAVSLHILLQIFGYAATKKASNSSISFFKLALVTLFILGTIVLSFLRTASLVTGYTAPLKVYQSLQHQARPGDTVCLGKEWYRFPSSFLLPDGVHAKFVRSEFIGLLPGEFSEAKSGFGLFPGAWLVPSGMNDENQEDPGKYIDIAHCTYLVDASFGSATATELEPDYLHSKEWASIACAPFLDTGATGILGRTVWLPDTDLLPARLRRKWGEYCLLKRNLT